MKRSPKRSSTASASLPDLFYARAMPFGIRTRFGAMPFGIRAESPMNHQSNTHWLNRTIMTITKRETSPERDKLKNRTYEGNAHESHQLQRLYISL